MGREHFKGLWTSGFMDIILTFGILTVTWLLFYFLGDFATVKMSGEENLSKNELKRRQKAEKKAAEKAEKEKEKAAQDALKPQSEAAFKKKDNEEDISPNEYFKLRSGTIEELKGDPGTHPYPHKFHVSLSLKDFIQKYETTPDGTTCEEVTVSVAGRIHAIRESGAKLIFYDLRGEGVKIQVQIGTNRKRIPVSCHKH